jgi:hypothetical protein
LGRRATRKKSNLSKNTTICTIIQPVFSSNVRYLTFVNNVLEHGPRPEADRRWIGQEIPSLLWNHDRKALIGP